MTEEQESVKDKQERELGLAALAGRRKGKHPDLMSRPLIGLRQE